MIISHKVCVFNILTKKVYEQQSMSQLSNLHSSLNRARGHLHPNGGWESDNWINLVVLSKTLLIKYKYKPLYG